eukprot:3667718-Amphidinium_carterae.2
MDLDEEVLRESQLEGNQRRNVPDRWPKPDGPNGYSVYKDVLNVALIMDDVHMGCQVPHDKLYRFRPESKELKKKVEDVLATISASAAANSAVIQRLLPLSEPMLLQVHQPPQAQGTMRL